jgi:hypothetical protein
MADGEGSSKGKDGSDKPQVAGQLLSGVLLAVTAFVVKIGADNIATSLQTGQLVEAHDERAADPARSLPHCIEPLCRRRETRHGVRDHGMHPRRPDAANPGAPPEQNQSLGTIAFQTIGRRCSEERCASTRSDAAGNRLLNRRMTR